jgi:hypothetical protein
MPDRSTTSAPKSQDDSANPAVEAASDSRSQKATLTAAALAAVRRMIASKQNGGVQPAGGAAPNASAHPMLEEAGHALGVGLGVIVTEALAAVPSWNQPVVDDKGAPVASVPGADRVGDHDILKRHEEVVGPKVTALVDKLPPGAVHDLLAGFGAGATEAPGDSYRLEAYLSDLLNAKG